MTRRRCLLSNPNGFSLFEVLAATAITGLVLATATPSLSSMVTAHQLQSALRSTTGYVRLVRATAVAKNLQSRLVVSADGTTLTTEVLRGGSWTATGSPVALPGSVSVSSVLPASGLTFTAQGTTGAVTTITLRAASGDTHTVTVSILGSVEVS